MLHVYHIPVTMTYLVNYQFISYNLNAAVFFLSNCQRYAASLQNVTNNLPVTM